MTPLEQQWQAFQEHAMRKAYDEGYRGVLYFWTYAGRDGKGRLRFQCTSAPPVNGRYVIRDMAQVRND